VVVDELARHRLDLAVLAPGSRSAPLAFALADESRIRLHVAIDERSAGFFALGAAKAGREALVVTTSGTATANLYPAVIEADAAGVALLVVTADRPDELRHTGANQTIDQVHLYGPRVRWFAELGPPHRSGSEVGEWRSVVSQAIALARGRGGRPGPVHLNLKFREPLVPASDDGRSREEPYQASLEGRSGGRPWTGWDPPGPEPPMSFPVEGRVMVVIGDGAPPGVAEEALAAGCVVIAEAASGGRVPGTISTAHHLLAAPSFLTGTEPDVVVQVGRAGLSRNLAGYLASRSERLVVDRDRWPDPTRNAMAVAGAIRFLPGRPDRDWAEGWVEADSVARKVIDDALDAADQPDEARVARDVAAAVPAGGGLVVGGSMPVRDLDWFMRPREGLRVVSNRGASGIDGFVSTSLGVAAAGSPVVSLSGDLALIHDQNGWLTKPRPDLVMVVVNNDGGGIFSFLPQASFPDHFERLFATPHGLDLALLARMYGLEHLLVTGAGKLAAEVGRRAAAGGSHLLEVRTDREANVVRHRQLTGLVTAALAELA
jgi:2-succinyl-5-enolpyruvyl-6-hydroxy-3-cyclohexene-1-carboxylate synthase